MIGRMGPKISSCKINKKIRTINLQRPRVLNAYLHDGICWCDVSNDGGRDEPLRFVALSADNHPPGGAADESLQALEVALVDDPAEVGRLDGLVAKPTGQEALGSADELLLHLLGAQQIVGSDASLAHIDQLAPENPLGGNLDVARAVQVDGTEIE